MSDDVIETARISSPRLLSLDSYRGGVMLLMVFSSWRWLPPIIGAYPDNSFLIWLRGQLLHLEWAGCTIWDMIQPSFMFMVGASLAFSMKNRISAGQSDRQMLSHAIRRAIILILLGVFLRSFAFQGTYWTFEDVLTQIGLGYVPLFLLASRSIKFQCMVLVSILVGYWALFALWPLPGPEYDYAAVSADKPGVRFNGFAAHWDKNANPAHYFDRWFLNLFPRPIRNDGVVIGPFHHHSGGYHTLSFIPSLATMLVGLLAGQWLQVKKQERLKILALLTAGLISMAVAEGMELSGVCPIVKRIWTPSWVLFSGGICLIVLTVLYAVIDVAKWKKWAYPLVVVGLNPITFYVMSWTLVDAINSNMRRHLGPKFFNEIAGEAFGPLLGTLCMVVILWLVTYWMYRRKIFIRI